MLQSWSRLEDVISYQYRHCPFQAKLYWGKWLEYEAGNEFCESGQFLRGGKSVSQTNAFVGSMKTIRYEEEDNGASSFP